MGRGLSQEVLLDTHILLWMRRAPDRLSGAQLGALKQAEVRWVSVASLYEIAQKVRIGKLDLAQADVDDLPEVLPRIGLRWLPLGASEMLSAAASSWTNRDPFDRMILAAAEARGCLLLTSDAALLAPDLPFTVQRIG